MGWRRSRLRQEKGEERAFSRVVTPELAAAERELLQAPVAEGTLLRDPRLARPANAEPRAALLRAGQHTVGNAAIQRLASLSGRSLVQGKLTVNPPGDIYEQEADRVAETVLRMPAQPLQRQALPEEEEEKVQTKQLPVPVTLRLQRQEEEEEEEEEPVQPKALPGTAALWLQRQEEEEEEELQPKPLAGRMAPWLQRQEEEEEEELQPKPLAGRMAPWLQRQEEEEEEEELQPKARGGTIQAAANGGTPKVTADLEERIGRLRGGGQPLGESERAFFEPRFGQDFTGVRIHTGAEAAGTALALRAKAFTVGQDIVFGAGEYTPQTTGGRGLLAHELTHVIQQSSQPAGPVPASGGTVEEVEAGSVSRQAIQREAGSGCAPGSTSLTVKNATRSVSASNLQQLAGILGQEAGSVGFIGSINAVFCPDDPAGKEPVESARLSGRLVKTMPKWTNAGQQCQEVQSHWQERLACLDEHENGHIEIHKGWYSDAHEQMVGKTVPQALARLDKIREEDDQEQYDYDARTDHGISQGSCTTKIDTNLVCPEEKEAGEPGEIAGEEVGETGPAGEYAAEEGGW